MSTIAVNMDGVHVLVGPSNGLRVSPEHLLGLPSNLEQF